MVDDDEGVLFEPEPWLEARDARRLPRGAVAKGVA